MRRSIPAPFLFAAGFFAAACVLFCLPSTLFAQSTWIDQLSCHGFGVWKNRIEFSVKNKTTEPFDDTTVAIPIEKSDSVKGQPCLPLASVAAQSIRVTDENGVELLFELVDSQGLPVHEGKLPEGSSLILPVTCDPGKEARFIVSFNNDLAWVLPDWYKVQNRLVNLGFEQGTKGVPHGWRFDAQGNDRRIEWSTENPYEGSKCVKVTVAPGSTPSWIAARQSGIHVKSGRKYRFSAWIKGRDVVGSCGWYAHIGNRKKEMMIAPANMSAKGTFDWRKVEFEFVVPDGADTMSFGTVLYGTGTAWFDAVCFEPVTTSETVQWELSVAKVEASPYSHFFFPRQTEKMFEPAESLVPHNSRYALFRLKRGVDSGSNSDKTTVFIDLTPLQNRWGRTLHVNDLFVLDRSGRRLPIRKWNSFLYFETELVKKGYYYFLVVEQPGTSNVTKTTETSSVPSGISGEAFPGTTQQASADGAFPGTSQQAQAESSAGASEPLPAELLKLNLVRNGDMEMPGPEAPYWKKNTPIKGVHYRLVDPKVPFLGKQALELTVDKGVPIGWRGSTQSVKVKPGHNYLCGLWMSCDSDDGAYQLHIHQRQSNGEISAGGMGSIGSGIGKKTPWTLVSDTILASHNTDVIQLHLTTANYGTVRHDGVFLIEIESASPVAFGGGKNGIFQVPSVVKVFHDSTFSASSRSLVQVARDTAAPDSAMIAAARNEGKSLQLAIRLEQSQILRVSATKPVCNELGESLPVPKVSAVGNVPVDYPSSYYNTRQKTTFRFLPQSNPACDGWSGIWPDPLIPINIATDGNDSGKGEKAVRPDFAKLKDHVWSSDSAKLAAYGKYAFFPVERGKTRALWLSFDIPENAPSGIYSGFVLLADQTGKENYRIPYQVKVFDFAVPARPVYGAIYDIRVRKFARPDAVDEEKIAAEYLASKKLCGDTLPASVSIKYDKSTGTATADWENFDKVAHWYFNELGIRYSYMPNGLFYLFGWGMPPRDVEGEHPYAGDYPYDKVDRTRLRPEYKKAYQAKLRCFWDHVKAKGWDKHFVLYISDEPFYSMSHIIQQMKALCEMIHEVDPNIPIYSSTWRHIPQWDGSLNVWGIGHYGIVSVAQLEKTKTRGDRIWWTTDGQMCLDTPCSAIERLLPYWCHYYGAEVYEFWGANWYTYDPFQYGWHSYIPQSDSPTNHYHVRYPNGDGYIFYPGHLIGLDGYVSSIRMEQAREGLEDAAYLVLLKTELDQCIARDSSAYKQGLDIWKRVGELVPIPTPSGRYSGRILPRPELLDQLKYKVAEAIVSLRSENGKHVKTNSVKPSPKE